MELNIIAIVLFVSFLIIMQISIYCFYKKKDKEPASYLAFLGTILIFIVSLLTPITDATYLIVTVLTIIAILIEFKIIYLLDCKEYNEAYWFAIIVSVVIVVSIVIRII